MRKGDWHVIFQCDECEHISNTWVESVCPKCGDKKSLYFNPPMAYGWTPKVARVVSPFIWNKPSTWLKDAYYEFE